MITSEKQNAFIIGKFYPLHNGHKLLIETALKEVDGYVIVCIGSADCTRVHIPYIIRKKMVESVFPNNNGRLLIHPLCDIDAYSHYSWTKYVRTSIWAKWPTLQLHKYYCGSKDDAEWMHGGWETIILPRDIVSGTMIRKRMLNKEDISAYVPKEVLDILTINNFKENYETFIR